MLGSRMVDRVCSSGCISNRFQELIFQFRERMKRLAEKKRKALGHIELEDREDEDGDGDAGGPAKKVKQVQFYGKEQMQDIIKPNIQV